MARNVLISGASVAGTTLAYWLHRHGFNVSVVERAPAIREGGYKIDIRGAALEVVKRMGVLGEIHRYSTAGQAGARAMFLFSSPPLRYDRRNRLQQQQLLTDAYANEGWEVPRLLAEVGNAPDFYFDSLSQVHMGQWSKGRVALVGDAAYCASPASGQGTSLALVGGYVLAGELRRVRESDAPLRGAEPGARAGEHQANGPR